jgi:hypothetical protein
VKEKIEGKEKNSDIVVSWKGTKFIIFLGWGGGDFGPGMLKEIKF